MAQRITKIHEITGLNFHEIGKYEVIQLNRQEHDNPMSYPSPICEQGTSELLIADDSSLSSLFLPPEPLYVHQEIKIESDGNITFSNLSVAESQKTHPFTSMIVNKDTRQYYRQLSTSLNEALRSSLEAFQWGDILRF